MIKVLSLLTLLIGVRSASAECWPVGRDSRGQRVYECDDFDESLPICGSEFDRGDRCVVRPSKKYVPPRQQVRPPPDREREEPRRSEPYGPTPFNPGGSWPNRAQEYSRGK